MGIEEYKFLTKTMEQIADCSGQLEPANLGLHNAHKQLRNSRKDLENATLAKAANEARIRHLETKVRALKHESSEFPSLQALEEQFRRFDPEGDRLYSGPEPVEENGGPSAFLLLICYVIAIPFIQSASAAWWNAHPSATEFSSTYACFLLIAPALVAVFWSKFEDSSNATKGLNKTNKMREQAKKLRDEIAPIERQMATLKELRDFESDLRSAKGGGIESDIRGAKRYGPVNVSKIDRRITRQEKEVTTAENRITSLEEEIQAHWHSIAHLIPYSSALEKA